MTVREPAGRIIGGREPFMSGRKYTEHPRVGVGAIVIRDGKVLLVKRGVAPSKGLWAIPGGMIELGETIQQAAEREILEETGIRIQARDPVYTFDMIDRDDEGRIRYHYVVVDVFAFYVSGEPQARDDVVDARWVAPEELDALPASPNTMRLLRVIRFCP
jgi:ADP-ribose pyrophosphatase